MYVLLIVVCFFYKRKTAYEMRISDWSSDVCSSDLGGPAAVRTPVAAPCRDPPSRSTPAEAQADGAGAGVRRLGTAGARPRPGHARLPHGHRRARARGKDLARQPARAGDRSRRLLTRHALRLCSLDTFVAPEMGEPHA